MAFPCHLSIQVPPSWTHPHLHYKKNYKIFSPGLGDRIQPPRQKIGIKIHKNLERSSMKNRPNFYKKGVHSDVCLSSTVTLVHNLKEIILYDHIMDKNLICFLEIHLHLAKTSLAKLGLKQEKLEIWKMRLKDIFYSPKWWHLWKKWERFFSYILLRRKPSLGFSKFIFVFLESFP